MTNKTPHNIDKTTKSILKHLDLKQPSLDFTEHIIGFIEKEKITISQDYKPVISKRNWIILFSLISLIILTTIFNTGIEDKHFTFLTNFQIEKYLFLDQFMNAINTIFTEVFNKYFLLIIIPVFILFWPVDRLLRQYFLR